MLDMLILATPLAVIFFAIAMQNWRFALLACVPVGFIQDTLRKIIPGEPVVLLATVVGAMGLVFIAASSRIGHVRLQPLMLGNQRLHQLLVLFITLVSLQAFMTLVRFGSPILAGIGMLSYLAPIPALWLTFHYVRQEADIENFLKTYLCIATIVAISIFLSLLGFDWQILDEVGTGLNIYDRFQRRYIEAHSGLLRAAEVAAWHMGAAACLAVILAVSNNRLQWYLWTSPLLLLFVSSGLLTGRRKMFVAFVAFLGVYSLMIFYSRQHSAKRAVIAIFAGIVVLLATAFVASPPQSFADLMPYLQRSSSGFGDITERFNNLGIASIGWAINRVGYFGLGAGTGSQGAQHFGGGAVLVGGSAEGGLGKIVAELGVPGLLLVIVLSATLARHLWRILRAVEQQDSRIARLTFGLSALLLVNIPMFIAASQIFGDPFVLLILGSCLGFILASPRVLWYQQHQQQRQTDAVENASEAPPPHGQPAFR